MASVNHAVEVGVPIRAAYDQWTQFEEFPRFMEGVEEVRQLDDTHLRWTGKIAGAERSWDAEITEQKPDERIAWTTREGVEHAGVVTFHRIDDTHTRVNLQLEYDPDGVLAKVGDALGLVERRAKGDMERFKSFIEARGRETGAWRGEVERPDAR